jgi:hypothetical protein
LETSFFSYLFESISVTGIGIIPREAMNPTLQRSSASFRFASNPFNDIRRHL